LFAYFAATTASPPCAGRQGSNNALLHPLRSAATCRNAGLHSGKRVIADKDEVPGSSPGRPTPIPAGQSAVGSEPGRLVASLGRAGAARPSPPASPSALPGPSTRTSGATTTTHRGRAQPRTAATPPVRQPRAAACSVPTAQPPATGAPHAGLACLVGQRASAAATALTQPGRVRRRNPTDQRATSVASPASSRPRPVDRAAPRRGRHGTSTRSRGAGCLAAPIWSPTPPPEVGGEGRVRTDGGGHLRAGRWIGGHHTAGRWTGGHLTAGPPDPGRRTQVTGHRTGLDTGRAAHQTAGQPDTGRRNRMGGHRMLDVDRRPTPWLASHC
jgi:hypothetical protein